MPRNSCFYYEVNLGFLGSHKYQFSFTFSTKENNSRLFSLNVKNNIEVPIIKEKY